MGKEQSTDSLSIIITVFKYQLYYINGELLLLKDSALHDHRLDNPYLHVTIDHREWGMGIERIACFIIK